MKRVALVIAFTLSAACGKASADASLAVEIENKVVAARPDLPIARYARVYAHQPDGTVTAIYSGVGGTSRWTTPDKLPVIYDGGCGVLTVRYDQKRHRLIGVDCNGVA